MTAKILIVEDEKKIAQLLKDYLVQAGYEVFVLSSGNEVKAFLSHKKVEMVLLDVMLPGKDGFEILKDIRKNSNLPVIMITARVEEIDRLLGLELGADDYVCKPFSPREVVARVKSLFRRIDPVPMQKKIKVGSIELDEESRTVYVDSNPLVLTPSEFGLLKVLLNMPNRVFSREELLDKVQGYQYEGYERTIDSHIKNLRKKISKRMPGKEVIISVYGTGYKLVEP